jgi:hypothetical protein
MTPSGTRQPSQLESSPLNSMLTYPKPDPWYVNKGLILSY